MPDIRYSRIVVGGYELMTLNVKQWLIDVLKAEFDEITGGTAQGAKEAGFPVVEVMGAWPQTDANFPVLSVESLGMNVTGQFIGQVIGDSDGQTFGETFGEQYQITLHTVQYPQRDVIREILKAVVFIRLRELMAVEGVENAVVSGFTDHQVTDEKPQTYYLTDATISLDVPHVYRPFSADDREGVRVSRVDVVEHFEESDG